MKRTVKMDGMPQIIRRKSKPKLFQCLLGTGKSRSAEDIRYIGVDVQDIVISRRNKSGGMEQSPDDNNNAKSADVPRILVNDHDVHLCQRYRSDKATQCLTNSERYK